VPTGSVEQQNGVRAPGDGSGNFINVQLHGLSVGIGHGEGCAHAARRADGSEQIGVLVTLVGRLARTGSPPGPLADDAILLSDPGFILKPNFDGFARGNMSEMRLQRRREVFLNAAIVSIFCPG
jgi:hypothetical protein